MNACLYSNSPPSHLLALMSGFVWRGQEHLSHSPSAPKSLLAALGPGKRGLVLTLLGHFPALCNGKSRNTMAGGWWQLLGLSRTSATATAGPARHGTLCKEDSWLLFKPLRLPMAIQTLEWSLTPAVSAQISRFPSGGVWVHLYFSKSCSCFHRRIKISHGYTDTEGSALQSQVYNF